MKKPKANKETHVMNTKYGMGDYYGVGIKQKIGRMREDQLSFSSVTPKKLSKPPKSLA